MKQLRAIFSLLFLIASYYVSAQQHHFIYLQTEDKQPFYAKLDKKMMSSTASGYLIIPKLLEGEYNITIGFPRSDKDEQIYTCKVNNKDEGYLIKNFGDKGWGLFNLQTMDVVMAGVKPVKEDVTRAEKTDEFSNMLSEVVNDPSIKQKEKPVAKQPEEKLVSIKEEKQGVKAVNKSTIIKKSSATNLSKIEAIYIDITGDKPDTIQVLIPIEKDEKSTYEPSEKQNVVVDPKLIDEKMTQTENNPVEAKPRDKKNSNDADKKFLPMEMKTTQDTNIPQESSSFPPMINSDCKANATDEDFFKLRKKMASADNEGEMLSVAQKFFKVKCYKTEQIKNLSVLFLKDPGKYKFFDLAFQFVSDTSNFPILQNQLSDSYYIARFKAMVTH